MSKDFRLGGDLPIDRLGFGAMRLPSQQGMGGPSRAPENGRAVLCRAVELGVNHIDTADFYVSAGGEVRANTLILEALHAYPSDLVIATKVGPIIRLRQSAPRHSGRHAQPCRGQPRSAVGHHRRRTRLEAGTAAL